MGNKNFILINGKKYDTVTGKQLTDNESINNKVTKTTINPVRNSGGVVDGVLRKPKSSNRTTLTQHSQKQTQKSLTLMRQAVKKPSPTTTSKSKTPSINKSHLGVSARRTEVAMQTPKSQHIQKYEKPVHRSSVSKTHSNHAVIPHTPASHQPKTNSNSVQPQKTPRPSAAQKMIEAALTNASSHTETHPHQKKKRSKFLKKLGISAKAAGMSSAILAGVLLGGFFAVQNVPNLSMRVAATRAGFNAQMPAYQPSGFSFKGPINYTTGKVTVSFKSNTDNREYEVVQQASNWNSDALLSNYIIAENKQYQTYLDRGRTLYIYDGSNATWVDSGVWYTVEGESDMTTDQLIRIAASI